jgi:DNA-directed RNA polymerase specialized sigma24 family protein
MRYVPHDISKALRGGGDEDLRLDVSILLGRLPEDDQRLLSLYSEGYSPHQAAEIMGSRKNPQQWFDTLVRKLTAEVNA